MTNQDALPGMKLSSTKVAGGAPWIELTIPNLKEGPLFVLVNTALPFYQCETVIEGETLLTFRKIPSEKPSEPQTQKRSVSGK